jgi:hypothetical protein
MTIHSEEEIPMKKTLTIHTVIYFLLYTVSLAAACFEAGLAYPATDGIGMIWLFPLVYQVLFLRSLRSAFKGTMTPAACLGRGIFTLGFIVIFWGISILLRIGGAPYQPREIIYPAVLFVGSAAVFALCLREYGKARNENRSRF